MDGIHKLVRIYNQIISISDREKYTETDKFLNRNEVRNKN